MVDLSATLRDAFEQVQGKSDLALGEVKTLSTRLIADLKAQSQDIIEEMQTLSNSSLDAVKTQGTQSIEQLNEQSMAALQALEKKSEVAIDEVKGLTQEVIKTAVVELWQHYRNRIILWAGVGLVAQAFVLSLFLTVLRI